MKKENSFINFDIRFENQYYKRTFINVDEQKEYSERQFLNLVSQNIHKDIKDSKPGLNYYSVSVNESDGMSWMLESIKNNIKRNKSGFNIFCIWDTISNFSISSIIDENFILQKAKKYKLISSFNSKRKSYITIIVSVIFSLLLLVLQQIIKENVPKDFKEIPNFFYSTFFWVVFVLSVLLGSILKMYFEKRKLPNKTDASNSLKKLILKKEINRSNQFDEFINSLYIKMSKEMSYPFFVFIDKYEKLDILSKSVISKYLQNYSDSDGAETWIISHNLLNKLDKPVSNNSYFNSINIFQLKQLEYQEKLELTKLINVNKEYADFSTIKEVCEGKANEEILNQNKKVIVEFLNKNPKNEKSYSSLDLLYLFSLNTKPYSSFYSHNILKDYFTKKNIRNNVLKEVLPNSSLTSSEIEIKFTSLKDDFQYLIESTSVNGKKLFRVKKISYDLLSKNTNLFDLPTPDKIHLFWALYIGDNLKTEVAQFITTRQLIFHILRVKYSFAELNNNKNLNQIITNIYNYTILAINQSIEVCYFNEIHQIIEYALILSETEIIRENETITKNLVRKIWQVYSILNRQNLLGYLSNYLKTNKYKFLNVEKDNKLDDLFFEFMDNTLFDSYEDRAKIFYYGDEHIDSVRIYFRTLSAWVSLSFLPISLEFMESQLFKCVEDSVKYIENSHKILDRLKSVDDTSFIEFDFRTISLSIWSLALSYSNTKCDDERLNYILKFIKNSLEIVNGHNQTLDNKKNSLFSTNYFFNSLFSEIATISIATIAIIIKNNDLPNYDKNFIEKINEVVNLINVRIDIRLNSINSLSDIIQLDYVESIDKLFNLSTLVWLRLDINSLYYFLSLKRVQFFSSFQDVLNTDIGLYIRNIDLPLNKQNFFGVMSNIIVANSFDNIELKTQYFQNASEIANNNNFGFVLRQQFAIYILKKFNITNNNFDSQLSVLLYDDYLYKYFQKLNDYEYRTYVVKFVQTIKHVENEKIRKKITDVIKARYDTVKNDNIRQEIDDWFFYDDVSESIRKNKEKDIDIILSYWEDKKSSWLYPSILELLIINGYSNNNASVLNESVELIRSSKNTSWNSYFNLANSLTDTINSSSHKTIIYNFLSKEIVKWEDSLPIDFLVAFYHKLYLFFKKEQYEEKLKKLEKEQFEVFHNSTILNLSKTGNYYQILIDYYDLTKWYGVITDITITEFNKKTNILPSEKIAFIERWKNDGAKFPTFTKNIAFRQLINSDFLLLSKFLFSKQAFDKNYDIERQRINEIIRNSLPSLFSIIQNMEELPKYFKIIFEDYLHRTKDVNVFK